MTDKSLIKVLTVLVLITIASSSILDSIKNTFPQCLQLDSNSYPHVKNGAYLEEWLNDKMGSEEFNSSDSLDFKKESNISDVNGSHWYKEYTITQVKQINSLLLNYPIMNNNIKELKNRYYLSNWSITCSYEILNNNENTVYFNLLITKSHSGSLYSSLQNSMSETSLFWRIDLLIDIINGLDKLIEEGYFLEDFNLKSIFLKWKKPGAEFFPFLNSHGDLIKQTNSSSLRQIHLNLANIIMEVLNPEIFKAKQLNSDVVSYNDRCTSYDKKSFFHPMYCRFFERFVVTLVEENGAANLSSLSYAMVQELAKLDRKASEVFRQKQKEIKETVGNNALAMVRTKDLFKMQRPYEDILQGKLNAAKNLDQKDGDLNQKTTVANYVKQSINKFNEVKAELQIDVDL